MRSGGPTGSMRPRFITTMRSERLNASIWSWVTYTIVMPEPALQRVSSARMPTRSFRVEV